MHHLSQGQLCPDIQTYDILNQPVDLQALRGAPLLLSFFREVHCGFCNRRMQELKRHASGFRARGLRVLAVIAGETDAVRQYANDHALPFRVVADPKGQLHQRFGLRRSTSGMLRAMARVRTVAELAAQRELKAATVLGAPILPADFVLHSDGTIARAYYGTDLGDHLPLSRVTEWLTHFAC